ncbi:tRNA pseudouridine(38-40) synthase TruA [Halalkalibacter akibai]|uniref:tRNA pseudouridine synthase A n=2 Tax=Bacillaceae TaxID=186817 RepID=TRUA_BACSV|nr:tRNA pseudouridine(38-40) synthase TruA [Halalkalibacter akibai]Q45557.1 RecName: Full=tRNA pseudouridine synthase A; AltName: Full=tRNA pseudouridine(38-40) synthase; AltName: Full=tRNA pseudouridylate synthase I; AltName: Full=tRNA-uridine isomerase I [Bacillus sp. KSM-64]AAA73188.1 unknown [Bacillus sp. KSM-64]GAE37115.1 tRNA pseudouridine synthase A [Halalkalibacter akibai JCM 9157]
MNNYKLMIQYDGGRYKGWQRLGNGENTIQGKIETVLSEMVGRKIEIIGSGRTDAGVHALGQVANVKLSENFTVKEVKEYLNRYLPHDISVTEVTLVPDRFHSRYNAKDKTYLYKIWNEDYTHPFMRKYSLHIEKKLHIDNMVKASQLFVGEHDFTAFSNAKSKKKTNTRTIHSITIQDNQGFIDIRVCGDGFLYNMVRKMVGTLIEVGLGEKEPEQVLTILESKDRSQAGFADATGLYLEGISF